jgi:DNA-binding transcriptional ArsR family regulator
MPHYHPNAWLPGFRNVRPGLHRRTEILHILEKESSTARILATQIDVSYSTILYHLHHLEHHKIVHRGNRKPPLRWVFKPVRQQTLNNYDARVFRED